jgi:hypothetical protein
MKNNIISDWLDKYGDPEIERKVEKEAEYINNVENYCKRNNLKFEKYVEGGFVASSLNSLKEIRKYTLFSNGDILDNGIY